MTYLNITEVESAIANLAAAYPSLCTLVPLPNVTFEGRSSHALRISSAPTGTVDAVVVLGGVHAREWGSCEILVNMATDLLAAYTTGSGLAYGGTSFLASTIAQVIDQRELVLYPLANPDGRGYSQIEDAHNIDGWRKNRNPASSGGDPLRIGVDVNRNYDFLWDFQTKFSPSAFNLDLASTDPSQLTFHGTAPFSEPETRNVRWLVDQFPRTRWFVDVHSFSELVLYSWGDDRDQTTDPSQNFQNTAYDGQRGVGGPAYGEFIPADDRARAVALATGMVDAINAVRGRSYDAEQSFGLYATSGASDDYMYSRTWVNPAQSKILSFVIEWGTEFHPIWSEMALVVKDVSAGLIAFCAATVPRAVTFEIDRDHYGQDEIDAYRAQPGGAVVQTAFRVVVDGYTARELGITGPGSTGLAPPIAFSPSTGIHATSTSLDSTDPAFSPDVVQRFRFGYDVDFGADDSAFTTFPGDTETVTLTTTFQGIPAGAQITLVKQPDPYIMQGAQTWWLSSDLRVLQIVEGDTRFGVTMGNDPEQFLLDVTAALEAGQGTAGGESFDAGTSEEEEILTVAPVTFRDVVPRRVFNFAFARVHYRGLLDPANHVRVFFRLFAANSTNTEFHPDSTYSRDPAAYPVPAAQWGEHTTPTPGVQGGEYVTIPCFGAPRAAAAQAGAPNSLPSVQSDARNDKDLAATGGPLHDVFYGCFLDINQSTGVLPMTPPAGNANGPWPAGSGVALEPLQAAFIRNEHQCLMAEIAFDPVPIATGTQPWNSDKLAQRNLSWSTVANPGLDVSRRALETFEVRPTPAALGPYDAPDEIVIEWSGVPAGAHAELYLPAVDADAVLARASELYPAHRLVRVDANTIGCTTGGVTYVPLPPGSGGGANFAGLMSIGLPAGIRKGQLYHVVIRQLTNASASVEAPPPGLRIAAASERADTLRWRRVLGTFQVNIPVSTKELMLGKEELRLSIFRWIAAAIPYHDRWHPVIQRYIHLLALRVTELGGDPAQITPSQNGYDGLPHGGGKHHHGGRAHEPPGVTGKVQALNYDHFGDFVGFVLELPDGDELRFESREAEIEALVRLAWEKRIRTTVVPLAHHRPGVRSLILRR